MFFYRAEFDSLNEAADAKAKAIAAGAKPAEGVHVTDEGKYSVSVKAESEIQIEGFERFKPYWMK